MRLERMLVAILLLPSVAGAQAGRASFDEGVRQMQANEPSKAERAFERAIKLEPGVGEYHLWLARAVGVRTLQASKLRQPFLARRSKAEFERAIALDSTLLDARVSLVQFHLQAPGIVGGSTEKAREQQREIEKLDPLLGHLVASDIAWHLRDTVATEASLREAIALAPDSARGPIVLSQRLESWGRTADAFSTLDDFLARRPSDVAVSYQVGRLAAATGERLEGGERILRQLLAGAEWEEGGLRPMPAVIHVRLGDILAKLGRPDEARRAYDAALALVPDLPIAKAGLKSLDAKK